MTIYDGDLDKASKVEDFCGDNKPFGHIGFKSTTNKMHIHFHSDHTMGKPGFKLKYYSYSKLQIKVHKGHSNSWKGTLRNPKEP